MIATVLAGLLIGEGPLPPLLAAGLYFGLAKLRSAVEGSAQSRFHRYAATVLTGLRREIAQFEVRAAAPSVIGDSGALAALTAEKLEALRPYLLR